MPMTPMIQLFGKVSGQVGSTWNFGGSARAGRSSAAATRPVIAILRPMRGISASHLAYVNVFAVRRPDRLPRWRLTVLVARWQLTTRMRLRDDATLQIASMLAAAANSESSPSDDLSDGRLS